MTEKASISTRHPRFPGIPLTLLLLAASCVFLASCSHSSSSVASAASSTAGALDTITISASSTSFADTDTTETVTANAADSNGVAITGLTFTWTSSNPNVATVNSSSAIVPVAPGTTTITASAGGVTSNAVGLTITAPLSGQYAFLLQGFDDATGDQVAIIGSFITDGNGNITSGVEDINGPPGGVNAFPGIALPAELSFTGTYTPGTGSQSPGIMHFITAVGTNEFAFSTGTLSAGVPTVGRMIEWDDTSGANSQRASGSFYQQNTSAFGLTSLSGSYAFQFFGQQIAPRSWYVATGAFTGDGNGNLTGTDVDTNVASSGVNHLASFAATAATNSTTTTDTTTFGQLLVTFTSGIPQTGYLYIVSPTQALFMEGDIESASGLEAGQILAQSTPQFSNAALNGVTVEYEEGLGTTAGRSYATIGLINFVTGGLSRDVDDSGNLSTQTASLTFQAPVTADGRVTLLNGGSPFDVVYLVGPNEGFIMSTTSTATMGFFQPQSGPFSAGSINGNYFGGSVPPTTQTTLNYMQSGLTRTAGTPVVDVVELASSGNGVASQSLYLSFNGGALNSLLQNLPSAFNISVASNGRATDNATSTNIYYLIGPTSFLRLNPAAAGPAPVPPIPVIDLFQQ